MFLDDLDFIGDADSLSLDHGSGHLAGWTLSNSNGWEIMMLSLDHGSGHLAGWILQNLPSIVDLHSVKNIFRLFLTMTIYFIGPELHCVPYILHCATGYIREVLDMEGVLGFTPLLGSIQMRNSTADLIRVGANVHKLILCPWPNRGRVSVTWIAMLSSDCFSYWRHSLLNSEVCIEHFVKQECENNWIVEEGWTEDSLLRLFQSEFAPTQRGEGHCDRCLLRWRDESPSFKVEIGWCVELERIKRNYVGLASSDEILTTSLELRDDKQAEDRDETTGLFCSCVWQYTCVCDDCWLEIKDTDHEHRDTYESEDSSSSGNDPDDLSDWEDSPFLPPLSA